MRKSCYDCVRKHLGSAGIFIKETKMGYPDYDIWVIGELEHAADECLEKNPDLAAAIREHRLLWMSDQKHAIPFESINRYIKDCVLAEQANIDTPALTPETLSGLEMDDSVFIRHGDTRP